MRQTVSEICLIAPSTRLLEKAQRLIAERGDCIQVYLASLENALSCAQRLMIQGAKIFISRAGTRAFLEQNSVATVVPIQSHLSDYIDIMGQAQKVNGQVAFFSYDPPSDEVKTMCHLLQIQAVHYRFQRELDTKQCVQQALADGVKLGVGGALVETFANRYGLPFLPLENSTESIILAIENAKRLLELQKQEQKKRHELQLQLEKYQAVFDFTHDAIISVDSTGSIQMLNAKAEKILQVAPGSVRGRLISQEIPDTRLIKALQTGEKQLDQVINIKGTMVYTNCIPILLNGQVQGAVATFQDVRELQNSEQKIRIGLHKKGLVAKYTLQDILGDSKPLHAAISIAHSYANTAATILLYGETGTGKELFAQGIHMASPRRQGPFVAVNCASLDKNMLESELFGYVEGAFTGASKGGRPGLFEMAHTGTIFLDEVGEIPLNIQARLLRVLQEKEIRRLGGSTVMPVDVRVIAATNRILEQEVAAGNFREDLFYRLNVLSLIIPPLRERKDDIQKIAQSFYRQLTPRATAKQQQEFLTAIDRLKNYSWPGNVRELANISERIAVLLSIPHSQQILQDMLDAILHLPAQAPPEPVPPSASRERQELLAALQTNRWVLHKTAQALGISRTTLWRKMQQHGLRKERSL